MSILIGVFCGLIAMLGWGIGEFLMKEPSKRIGEIEIFFYMQFIGAIITIPIFINYIKNKINIKDTPIVKTLPRSIELREKP